MRIKTIKIANKNIGPGNPVFIIAEIGFLCQAFEPKNGHPGAKQLIDAAIKAGADAIKIQTFKGETWLAPHMEFDMENTGKVNGRKHVKPYELDFESHKKIFGYCKKKNIIIFSTPSHSTDVDLLEKFNPPVYKVGSDDLTNLPFLQYIAKTNKPMIVSTGMSNFTEVNKSVKTILSFNKKLIILHCVSNYPAYPEDANLRIIPAMQKKLGIPIGWSDHIARNNSIALAAVVLGANVIEKHFTIDYTNPSPDTMLSATFEQFRDLVKDIRTIEKALGTEVKRPTEKGTVRIHNRKSITALRDINKGEILELNEKNFGIFRPGYGLPPEVMLSKRMVKTRRNIKAWQTVTKDDIKFV